MQLYVHKSTSLRTNFILQNLSLHLHFIYSEILFFKLFYESESS